MRRIFLAALLLTLGFAASGAALAAQGDSADNPIIIITTAEQLDAMRNGLDKHYKLAADIDLTEFLTDPKGWIPVGGSEPDGWVDRDESARFTGSLDGDGHAITGLWINRDRNYVGLFGSVQGATMKNLRIEIADKGITGDSYVGGLVGYARSVTIANCRISGNVTGGDDPVYGSEAGGLAGLLIDMCFVTDCGVTGDITGSANGVGGLVGSVASESVSIANCFFEGSVKSAINYVGGLVGSLRGKAVNCYAAGSVTGKSIVGGITGFLWNGGELANSFAMCDVTGSGDRIGEVTGKQEGTFTNNRVLTGAERFSKKTYTDSGWIFDPETGPWQWVEGRYPQLVENGQTTASSSAAARPIPDESDAGGDAWQDFPSLDDWDTAAATPKTEDATEEVSGEADGDALQDFPALDSWDAAAATPETEEVSGEDDADALQDFPSLDDWDAAAATPETEDATEEVSDSEAESDQDGEDEPDAQDEADAVFAMNFDDDADFAALREDAIRKASEFYDMSDFPQDDRTKEAALPQAMAVVPAAPAAPAASGVMGERTAYNAIMEDLKQLKELAERMAEEVASLNLEDVGEVERLEAGIGMYRRLGSEASAMLEKYSTIDYDVVKAGKVHFQTIIDMSIAEAKPLQERLALLQQLKGLQDQVTTLQQQRGGSEPSQAAQTPEPSDPVERLRWRAERGDADAQVDLGNLYADGKGVPLDYAEAMRWYRLAVEQGSARGQNNLGVCYSNGRGVPMNKAEAARWFRLAADQGLAVAQAALGFLYDNGEGVPMNKGEAARLYRLAAEQGLAIAQYNLGLLYNTGQGVPMNKTEAARWYRQAAEQGHAEAQNQLGFLYWSGQGVSLDYVEAARWYQLSANQGLAAGQYNLGVIYTNGQGVSTNYAEAARLYRLAAEQGYASAQSNLGALYSNGQGVPMNKAEAVRLYRLAAEQGDAAAQHNLGTMYAKGEGVYQDLDQAEWWLQQAANQGFQQAIDALQQVRQMKSGGRRQHYHHPGGWR